MNNTEKITKHLVFPVRLAEQIERKASRIGFTFAEYLRHIAASDIEDEEVEYLDEETEKEVLQAMDEYKRGEYYTISDLSDLRGFLADSGKKRKKK